MTPPRYIRLVLLRDAETKPQTEQEKKAESMSTIYPTSTELCMDEHSQYENYSSVCQN